jgi:hypothetical protein
LVQERKLRKLFDELVQILRVEQVRVPVHFVHRRVPEESVRKPGGMAHQLVHRRLVVRVDKNRLAVRVHTVEDLQMRKLGNVLCDRIGGQPLALFVQNHHGHAGDRLGHGVVAKDRVLRHGRAACHVALAVGAVVDDLAVARKDRNRSGDLLAVDRLLHICVQSLQAFGGKPLRLGACDREVDRGRGILLSGKGICSERSACQRCD